MNCFRSQLVILDISLINYDLIVVVVVVVVCCGSSLKLLIGPIQINKYKEKRNSSLFEVTNDETARQRQHASGTNYAAAL